MNEYPMTFREFVDRFLTEEKCREYLYKLRWQDGFVCPKCGHNKCWAVGSVLYECASCGRQTSVIAGTIFQDTRSSLQDWFTAIWWITTQKIGASAQGLQQLLGLKSYNAAWAWLHKIRTAMVFAERTKLDGRVEVDETYLGGEDVGGARGRGAIKKTLILVAVEIKGRAYGRVRLRIAKDASAKSLHAFVKDNIEEGSTLVTDAWSGYSSIEDYGYKREIYNQSKAQSLDEMLPHVHTIISLLKRWLLGTHQGSVRLSHLQAYLEEYTFRFNRRNAAKRGLLFYRLLENAMRVAPTTYNDLLGHPKP
jgi:transposase-like protein/DNA-directed RNA polymerase subunit RPC12/RpoP